MKREPTSDWPHVVVLEPESAGLALARAMVRAGARVTLVVLPGHELETHSRGVEHVVASYEPDGEPWLEAVQRLAADGGELAVLPMTDRGSELLSTAAARVPPNARAFERSSEAHMALMDKETADGIARRAGVAVPWTRVVHSVAELDELGSIAPWPCVVKPIYSHAWRERYGEERVFVVRDAQEAAQLVERPLRDGIGMLLCQYIPGGDADVEEAIVVRLADGSYPVCFGCHKLRQSPRGFGATAVGVSDPLPETTAMARRVLDAAGFVGVAGVETKRHRETGERWFLEVNVRVPAQWGLGDACGADASRRLVAALAGRELGEAPVPRAGVGIIVPVLDAAVVRKMLREVPRWRQPAQLLRLLRPYLKARELGLLDPRDPGPGLAWARSVLGRRMARRRSAGRDPGR
jgi:predicted ATP-grasp superfamily ATP-dependent carboligase